jgi:23S rRNA (cytidine1920-2'-O)/16S rRNA (cytidine1409-2'-O)-methyltransferase
MSHSCAAWRFIDNEAVKLRLDKLVVDSGLATTRERAQALIVAGRVMVNEQKVTKSGAPVADDAVLRILNTERDTLRYVSRGGLKLAGAIEHWKIELAARSCLDVGASTGGFTDCMLQAGAKSVLAIDTGYGQIAHSLRVDPRVALQERTNARLLAPGDLPDGISFLAMDVSFISVTLVLPAVLNAWRSVENLATLEAVILVKPQFEAGREHVGKGGIVRDESARLAAVARVSECALSLGGIALQTIPSPITGTEGNVEYLLHTHFAAKPPTHLHSKPLD